MHPTNKPQKDIEYIKNKTWSTNLDPSEFRSLSSGIGLGELKPKSIGKISRPEDIGADNYNYPNKSNKFSTSQYDNFNHPSSYKDFNHAQNSNLGDFSNLDNINHKSEFLPNAADSMYSNDLYNSQLDIINNKPLANSDNQKKQAIKQAINHPQKQIKIDLEKKTDTKTKKDKKYLGFIRYFFKTDKDKNLAALKTDLTLDKSKINDNIINSADNSFSYYDTFTNNKKNQNNKKSHSIFILVTIKLFFVFYNSLKILFPSSKYNNSQNLDINRYIDTYDIDQTQSMNNISSIILKGCFFHLFDFIICSIILIFALIAVVFYQGNLSIADMPLTLKKIGWWYIFLFSYSFVMMSYGICWIFGLHSISKMIYNLILGTKNDKN